jgi:hypothetical protein
VAQRFVTDGSEVNDHFLLIVTRLGENDAYRPDDQPQHKTYPSCSTAERDAYNRHWPIECSPSVGLVFRRSGYRGISR